MEIRILKIDETKNEYIEIGCHKTDTRVQDIVRFIKNRQGSIEAVREEQHYQLPITDIYYIEAVDDKTFIYLKGDCFETRKRLYEFEELLSGREFGRISKSVLVNLMKISSIKPALNGRFMCILKNGEKVIISRKYVSDIKEMLKGEKV
ncbi:LytTR family DNA-binding domain-containing protein [Butyrivibrio sp. WCD3002]|uniref:LytTR family DNA-binding domain-containing protein n=1 Tax=Butyrivibrio sp. WCD3002 TaxID=1280676 RepID=UPI000405A250|nr:LytTR family DNA-binding domain-containing protein [Butyrivibrio sp. WCD3002]